MPDRSTPNLPSRDLVATSAFYARLGFRETFRDEGWLILERGSIQLEFFPRNDLDPRKNIASCCIRVSDAAALHEAFQSARLPTSGRGVPRITSPMDQPWGLTEFVVVDPDGNVLRCISPLPGKADGHGTMAITIKVLGPDDAGVLQHVAPDVFDDPIHAQRAEEFLADPRHHLAVAIDDGLVVGFVSAVHYVHPDKACPELWINEVSVAPTHRRRGLGRRLLHSTFAVARRIGCAEAWVGTERANTAAMGLYSVAGSAEGPTDFVMFTFRLGGAAPPEL
jgi:aminoglycoside 6'-N-acetyltransferase I